MRARHYRQGVLALAVSSIVAGTADRALGVAITAAPENFEVQHRSNNDAYLSSRAQINTSGANAFGLRIGYQANFVPAGGAFLNGGIDTVYHFKLPTLVAGETVTSASLSFSVLHESSTGTTPSFNVDLYAIGFDKNDPPDMGTPTNVVGSGGVVTALAQTYFFNGTNQTGTGINGVPITKIQEDLLQPADWVAAAASPNNVAHATSAQAGTDLASYIMTNLYGNAGFTPNHDSLMLRLTPDSTTLTTGTQRYYVSYQQMDNAAGGLFPGALLPTLTLTTSFVGGSEWIKDDSTSNWSSPSSWTGGVPDGAGAVALFGSAITADRTVNVDSARVLGSLTFNNVHSYTLDGFAVTIDAPSGGGSVSVATGSHFIGAMFLAKATTFNITPANGALTVSLFNNAGKAVRKGGAGTLVVNLIRGGALSLDGGKLLLAADGTVTGVSFVDSTTFTGAAQLDISNNHLIDHTTGVGSATGGTYNGLSGLIQSGRNGGGWGGNGIVTSQTSATTSNFTSIGIATGSQVKGIAATATAVWAGHAVTGSDSLVMYTYGGDANLDGKVNVDDYGHIDSSIPIGLTGWFNGDFNYDGKINVDDYGIIDFNIGIQGSPFFAGPDSEVPGTLGAVPEPAAGVLLLAAAVSTSAWRRRRQS